MKEEWMAIDIEQEEEAERSLTPTNPTGNQGLKSHNSAETESNKDSLEESGKPKKIVIPSVKKMRQATLEGIKIGILPEYQDYSVVLEYLVKQFVENDFKFHRVMEKVPWLGQWIVNPFNANLLNEELELAAKLEASRIHKHIQFLLRGGCCSRTCGWFCSIICCCIPCMSIACKIVFYFVDLIIACVWGTCCDWWLGAFCRTYILPKVSYVPKFIKIKLENWLIGDSLFEDEELSIKNIYESNSYRIANYYACLLFLAILLAIMGFCMVTISYLYLPSHGDQLFMQVESVLGIILLASGFCGMQFYCRCTL